MSVHFKHLAELKTLLETKTLTNDGILELDTYQERSEVIQSSLWCISVLIMYDVCMCVLYVFEASIYKIPLCTSATSCSIGQLVSSFILEKFFFLSLPVL